MAGEDWRDLQAKRGSGRWRSRLPPAPAFARGRVRGGVAHVRSKKLCVWTSAVPCAQRFWKIMVARGLREARCAEMHCGV